MIEQDSGKSVCALCGSSEAETMEKSSGYRTLKCTNCGLVYVSPVPSKKFLETAYSTAYYTPWLNEQREARTRIWKERLETLTTTTGEGRGKLLDVGSAEGLFLELAKADGWEVAGTEISAFAAGYGKDTLGLNIFHGELADAAFPDKAFDAVTLWHVLEHTTGPLSVLREIRRIVKDDGILILALPNLDNKVMQIAYRLVKGKARLLFSPEDRELHLYHFNKETIQKALEKTGFEVVKTIPDRGICDRKIIFIDAIARAFDGIFGTTTVEALEIHAKPV